MMTNCLLVFLLAVPTERLAMKTVKGQPPATAERPLGNAGHAAHDGKLQHTASCSPAYCSTWQAVAQAEVVTPGPRNAATHTYLHHRPGVLGMRCGMPDVARDCAAAGRHHLPGEFQQPLALHIHPVLFVPRGTRPERQHHLRHAHRGRQLGTAGAFRLPAVAAAATALLAIAAESQGCGLLARHLHPKPQAAATSGRLSVFR